MTRVLITGGGSGTGADMARAFAAQGHEVVGREHRCHVGVFGE